MKLPVRILGLTLSLAGLAGVWFLQGLPVSGSTPVAQEAIAVTTDAKPLQVYCPGPLVELGGKDGTDLGSLALIGKANVSYRLGTGSLLAEPESKIEAGAAITMASAEQGSTTLTAAQTQLIQRPRMAGFAATNCGQPQAEGWLLTGLSGTGFESILLVANPNPVEVQVEITFHLETSTTSQLITLAPFAQQQLSVASFVEGEPQFAVHFQSSGQKVSVALQNRSSAGLSATGVELKGPTAEPAKNLVIPGFEILADGLAEPSLRIFNPGGEVASALVTFVGSGTNSDVVQVEVPAGGFALVTPKLEVGQYLVLIEAQTELMAELYNPYLSENFDFAWLSPVAQVTGQSAMAIPSYAAKLALANPSDKAISVLLTLDSGTQAISIPARSQILVGVTGKSLVFESQGEYHANLILRDPKGYAVISQRENANLGSDIRVLVR
jgi:hypothetical protein